MNDKNLLNENKSPTKQEILQFIKIVVFTIIVFIIIIIFSIPKNNKIDNTSDLTLIDIQGIESGFLYYDNEIYYRNKNLALISQDDLSEQIGINERKLMYSDVNNNKIAIYNNESLDIYAVAEGTAAYKLKSNDNAIAIPNDNAFGGYSIYIKDELPSNSKFNNLKYYKENQDDIYVTKLIGYMSKEVPIEFHLDDFNVDENTYSFGTIENGYMAYYLLVQYNGLYAIIEGKGNILSNTIVLNSYEDGKLVSYSCEYKGLNRNLVLTFSDFFGIELTDEEKDWLENGYIDDNLDYNDNEIPELETNTPPADKVEYENNQIIEDGVISQDMLNKIE